MSDITRQPEVFITPDGLKFSNVQDAECHVECVEAFKTFEIAQNRLFAAIAAKHYQTADGQPFTIQGDKWLIVERMYEPPYVVRVELHWYSSEPRCSFQEDGALIVSWNGENGKRHERPASDFYTSEKSANLALIELRKKHLEWWQGDLEKLQARVAKM